MSRDICLRCLATSHWWRGEDLNLRPSGYEPDELPDCSTPRRSDHSTRHRGPDTGVGEGPFYGVGGGAAAPPAGEAVGAAADDSGASVRGPCSDS